MITVLIIDNEQSDRTTIRNEFPWEKKGFLIIGEADSKSSALNIIRQKKPDIVLTGINMPDMSGLKFAEYIREMYENCHIIITSKYGDFDFARKAMRIGVDDLLLKPLNLTELNEVLQRIKNKIAKEYRPAKKKHQNR